MLITQNHIEKALKDVADGEVFDPVKYAYEDDIPSYYPCKVTVIETFVSRLLHIDFYYTTYDHTPFLSMVYPLPEDYKKLIFDNDDFYNKVIKDLNSQESSYKSYQITMKDHISCNLTDFLSTL